MCCCECAFVVCACCVVLWCWLMRFLFLSTWFSGVGVFCERGFAVCVFVCGVVVLLYVLICCFKMVCFVDVIL